MFRIGLLNTKRCEYIYVTGAYEHVYMLQAAVNDVKRPIISDMLLKISGNVCMLYFLCSESYW